MSPSGSDHYSDERLPKEVWAAVEWEESSWAEVKAGKETRSPMFEFARVLKALPEFVGLTAMEAIELVEKVLGSPLDEIVPDHEDPRMSFLAIWDRVVRPDLFALACAMSRRAVVRVKGTSETFWRFLAICATLQELCPGAPIIVALSPFSKELGVSPRMVGTYRELAVRYGFLILESQANHGARKAARYWYRWKKP